MYVQEKKKKKHIIWKYTHIPMFIEVLLTIYSQDMEGT